MTDFPITSAAQGLRLLADIIDANPDIAERMVGAAFNGYDEADFARLVTVLNPDTVSADGNVLSGHLAGLRLSIYTTARLTSEESLVRTLAPLSIDEIRRRASVVPA